MSGQVRTERGFYMPAEYMPHQATIMIFPVRPGSWPYSGWMAQDVFANIIREIAGSEKVYVIVDERTYEAASLRLKNVENIELLNIQTDDAWARDTAPTFVTNGREVRGINWRFNAWGGDYNGLYRNWGRDDKLASAFLSATGFRMINASPFVLEGGSIHSNGVDTLLTT